MFYEHKEVVVVLSFTTKCKVQIFYNFEKEFFKTKFQISGDIGTANAPGC